MKHGHWTKHKKNDEMLKSVKTRKKFINTPRNRRKKWLRHVFHHGSLVRTVLEGRLPGKEGKGKPKEMLLSWLLETSNKDMNYSQLKELGQEQAR